MQEPIIAALFVQSDGCYSNDPRFDAWPESRDARLYSGNLPVIAHPPCQRWCRLAGLVEKRWGHKRGDDGGCFAHALAAVRMCGGVLEHPAYSSAWKEFYLPLPVTGGEWSDPDAAGGRSCYVEQWRYGHAAKKATWLYSVGGFPTLRWGRVLDRDCVARVSWCGNRISSGERRPRLGKKAAESTPEEFREELVSIALSSRTK